MMPKRKRQTLLDMEHVDIGEDSALRRTPKKRPVWVLNADDQIMNTIKFNDAIIDLWLGEVDIVEPWGKIAGQFIQGPPTPDGGRVKLPWPIAVRYNRYIYVKYGKQSPLKGVNAARLAVLKRDNFTCLYCGVKGIGNTVDHIWPESRGGEMTWMNLVAACQPCNSLKRNRTPEEAGMKLLYEPYVPELNRYAKEQKEVWKLLKKGGLKDD